MSISNKTDNRLDIFNYNNSIRLIQVGNSLKTKKIKQRKE